MEVKFKRTYAPRFKFYALGEINVMHGFAVELTEQRPRLAEGSLEPGEMLVILFGVTPEEYALRESAPRQLEKLVDSIRKNYPADRLIGYVIRDLKGTVIPRQIRPDTTPSIDEGAFAGTLAARTTQSPVDAALRACAEAAKTGAAKDAPEEARAEWERARKAAAKAVLELDSLYVADDALMNGRFPAFGFDAHIELFTDARRGENAREQFRRACGDVDIYTIRQVAKTDYANLFATLRSIGAEYLRIDNGFSGAKLLLSDLTDARPVRDAAVVSQMLREIQYGLRWNRMKQEDAPERAVRGAMESTLTMKNFARRELGLGLLYIVCPGGATGLCATQGAMARAGAGARPDKADPCVMITDKRDGKNYFTVFTSSERASAFAKRMKTPSHVVAATFDEVSERTQCEGLIVNIDDLGYRVLRGDYDNLRQLRKNPPTVVRVRSEEETEPAREQPHVDSALPDPDAFLPKKEEPKEEEFFKDAPAEAPGEKQRTRLLGRLFGKKNR